MRHHRNPKFQTAVPAAVTAMALWSCGGGDAPTTGDPASPPVEAANPLPRPSNPTPQVPDNGAMDVEPSPEPPSAPLGS